MRTTFASLALILALALPAAVAAHPGHDHKLMGTITSIDGQTVVMKTTDGKDLTVTLTSVTKVLNGKLKADARDLKAGMRVVINVGDGAEPLKAKEVQYSTAAATAKK